MTTAALTWRKSSRSAGGSGSGNTGDCVEVACSPTGPLLRDSKTGNHGPILATTPSGFDALLDTIKHGR